MEKNLGFYVKFFWSTFCISLFTFGGGYVIVTLMQKKFVDELKWIDEKEMLDLVAIAQSAPGVIAINASILIGYRLAGIKGSLLAILATALPPLIVISVIAYFYIAFKENIIVKKVLAGMQIGVAAVIFDVVYSLAKGVVEQKDIVLCIIMLASFIAAYFFEVNVAFIILVCAFIGVLRRRLRK